MTVDTKNLFKSSDIKTMKKDLKMVKRDPRLHKNKTDLSQINTANLDIAYTSIKKIQPISVVLNNIENKAATLAVPVQKIQPINSEEKNQALSHTEKNPYVEEIPLEIESKTQIQSRDAIGDVPQKHFMDDIEHWIASNNKN